MIEWAFMLFFALAFVYFLVILRDILMVLHAMDTALFMIASEELDIEQEIQESD